MKKVWSSDPVPKDVVPVQYANEHAVHATRALWVKQGQRVDVPVIIKNGTLQECIHGAKFVNGWSWSQSFMNQRPTAQVLWDWLKTFVDVEQVDRLECCPKCQK